ncbi:MAG: HEAT repeat domain-containing protein [Acidobacteriota bacterium]
MGFARVEGKDTKKDDRLMAVVAMGFTKEKRAVDVLNGMLASDDKDLRENAYKALGNLGATDMCPVILQRIMGESSGQVMRAMIQTLSRLRCKEACATFEKMKATMNFREAEFRTLDEEIERAKAAIPCGSAPKQARLRRRRDPRHRREPRDPGAIRRS